MVRLFYHKEKEIEKTDDLALLTQIPREHLLWADLQFPTPEEQLTIEKFFNINFSEQQEVSDIESNSRFYETEDFIYINSGFTSRTGENYENCQVYFYLMAGILITKRNADLSSFAETVKK